MSRGAGAGEVRGSGAPRPDGHYSCFPPWECRGRPADAALGTESETSEAGQAGTPALDGKPPSLLVGTAAPSKDRKATGS